MPSTFPKAARFLPAGVLALAAGVAHAGGNWRALPLTLANTTLSVWECSLDPSGSMADARLGLAPEGSPARDIELLRPLEPDAPAKLRPDRRLTLFLKPDGPCPAGKAVLAFGPRSGGIHAKVEVDLETRTFADVTVTAGLGPAGGTVVADAYEVRLRDLGEVVQNLKAGAPKAGVGFQLPSQGQGGTWLEGHWIPEDPPQLGREQAHLENARGSASAVGLDPADG